MNPLEEEYKNKFKDEQLPSDGFEADRLWDSISEELHGEPSSRVRPLWWISLSGIAILFTWILWPNPKVNTQDVKLIDDSTISDEAPIESNSVPYDEEEESFALYDVKTKQTDSVEKHESKIESVSLKKESKTTKNTRGPMVLAVQEEYYSSENPIANAVRFENKNEAVLIDSLISDQVLSDVIEWTNKEKVQTLKCTPIDGMSLSYLELSADKSPILKEFPIVLGKDVIQAKSAAPTLYIQLYGGSNIMEANYKGDGMEQLIDLNNQSERIFPSGQFGVRTDLLFNSGISAHLGIEYQQHRTIFEREQENPVSVLLEDQLITVWLDATSLDTLAKEYGSIFVDGIETRNVIQNNSYKMLVLPLGIGYSKQIGNVMLGLEGGLYLGFTLDQNGKRLDDNGLIESFDNESIDRPLNGFMLGYKMSPFIAVKAKSNLYFELRPEVSGFANQQSGNMSVYSSPLVFKLNAAVKYQIEY